MMASIFSSTVLLSATLHFTGEAVGYNAGFTDGHLYGNDYYDYDYSSNYKYENYDPYFESRHLPEGHINTPDQDESQLSYQPRMTETVRNSAKSYKPPQTTKYVPVVVKKKKKKQKIISISKGVFIPGGTQVFGKFKSLKACMRACGASGSCFAGDYNPWVGKCYFHSNVTACNTASSHRKITHFKKVPCTITDAPRGRIILGTHLFGAVIQKGIDDLSSCLKKCANLGPGISGEALLAPTALAAAAGVFGQIQICYGVNYDFGSHRCYFIINNFPRLTDALRPTTSICPIVGGEAVRVPLDLRPNPSTVTIILCPPIAVTP